MSAQLVGIVPNSWRLDRDEEGHRTYKITHHVRSNSNLDGPGTVFNCPGLPLAGSIWSFGDEYDIYAYCLPTASVRVVRQDKNHIILDWYVDSTFSTKRNSKRCQDEQIEDPLLEPPKVSGSFVTQTEEAAYDMDGEPIITSAKEAIRGPRVEFDTGPATVRIEVNAASLGLPTFAAMIHTVNASAMWGVAARCVKLDNVTWSRNVFATCSYYYTRAFDFCVNPNTFDRVIHSSGNMAVGRPKVGDDNIVDWIVPAGWDNTKKKYRHQYIDSTGHPAIAFLNGSGVPIDDPADAAKITVKKYPESNFFLLGIPTSF